MTVDQDPRGDRDLLEEIAAGDRGALQTLFTRHQPWLAARPLPGRKPQRATGT